MKKGDIFFSARRAGVVLYTIAFVVMVITTIIIGVVTASADIMPTVVAAVMTAVVLFQFIYFMVLHGANKTPGTLSSGSSVVAILFFPLFGFPRLFFTALERSDKKRTSAKHIAPIKEAFNNFDSFNKELDAIVARRSEQASLWYSSTNCITSSTKSMQDVISKIEIAAKEFITVCADHVVFVAFDDSVEVKRMQEVVINTKVKMFRARDMELFFEKHVDAVKVYNNVLCKGDLTANGNSQSLSNAFGGNNNNNNSFNGQNTNSNFNNQTNNGNGGNNNFNGGGFNVNQNKHNAPYATNQNTVGFTISQADNLNNNNYS